MAGISSGQFLERLVSHISLPPQLPSRDDSEDGKTASVLGQSLAECAKGFRSKVDAKHYQDWSTICHALNNFATLHKSSTLDTTSLRDAFEDLSQSRDGMLAVHIQMQNAGLLIQKSGEEYVFEAFEASARAASVLASPDALRWDFPTRAIMVSVETFQDARFQEQLAVFLERASIESIKEYAAKTRKAGSYAFESRDTTNPALIVQLLMTILQANGSTKPMTITRKRVRDEVFWDDGAKNPWRRSPAWLILRLGVQRALCSLLGGEVGTVHYKFFIAYFITHICEELTRVPAVNIGHLAHLRAKLARRLAKLEKQRETATPHFKIALESANEMLNTEWAKIRQSSVKTIPRLGKRADDKSLTLSLVRSRAHLLNLCQMSALAYSQTSRKIDRYDVAHLSAHRPVDPKTKVESDIYRYLRLFQFEYSVEVHSQELFPPDSLVATDRHCSQLANKIIDYQDAALLAYSANPEQSSVMILTIIEVWMALDMAAIKLFPLLMQYDPGIPHDCLEVLQLVRLSDLRRLRVLQNYLQNRKLRASHSSQSVFGDVSKDCFSVKYFESCDPMPNLLANIKANSEMARDDKKQEWEDKCAEYENLVLKAARTTCLRHEVLDRRTSEIKIECDSEKCDKHFLERKAGRLRIQKYEDPLPNDDNIAKAVVFELLCPTGFACWRDATWNIICKLGRESKPREQEPRLLLSEYSPLKEYSTTYTRQTGITLASRDKSFLQTHYANVGFPVHLEKVCLPNGLRLRLYDKKQKLWMAREIARPSFVHHCCSFFPSRSPLNSLGGIFRTISDRSGPTSNEVISSQTECPAQTTVFEYVGLQDLSVGEQLRWVHILRELGSPNVNFGSTATVAFISHLTLQVGSQWEDRILRLSHWIFEDENFCAALLAQVDLRLRNISNNWREGQTLECLITLVNRLWELGGSANIVKRASDMLRNIRAITFGWMKSLQQDILASVDANSAKAKSRDALFAALLCRRTFVLEIYVEPQGLEPEALSSFIESSIVLNDNVPVSWPGKLSDLPSSLRAMIIRDLKLVNLLEPKLRCSMLSDSSGVDQSMNSIWPQPAGGECRKFSKWEFLPKPHDKWIAAYSIGTTTMCSQSIHYNILDGSLLIDKQRLRRLPEQYSNLGLFRIFLGDRLYMTYPSSILGMSYMLANRIEGNQVHFGFRDKRPVMRAVWGNQMLELIPPEVFVDPKNKDPDLPRTLINKHVHWLDLASGMLHITPQTSMWRSKLSDWVVDIQTCQVRRRNSTLVDIRSNVYQTITRIFEPFEDRDQIIVFQPQKSNLSVRLPVLDLSFRVNGQGLLESQQLQAMVDTNQDAGTLYGLESKLVLRSSRNPRDRSIIVRMGPAVVRPYLSHVRVKTQNSPFYCRFTINSVLNRLDCPAEPRVVYMKAYCHALTSYILEDPLTGKTGTEEALSFLSSGIVQPWSPIDEEARHSLARIASLSPQRSYYPEDKKVLSRIIWNENLAFPAQDDRLCTVVTKVLEQHVELSHFGNGAQAEPPALPTSEIHLQSRARKRNYFHCSSYQEPQPGNSTEVAYQPRYGASSLSRSNAFQAASLVRSWSLPPDVCLDLANILHSWPLIQGFGNEPSFETFSLDQLLELDIAAHWGSIIEYCQKPSTDKDTFRATLFFATLAFNDKMDMRLLRTLIAFATVEEFQILSKPQPCDNFVGFSKDQIPVIGDLVRLMWPSRIPPRKEESQFLDQGLPLSSKQRKKIELEQEKYEKRVTTVCEGIAEQLLDQWPCLDPSFTNFAHDIGFGLIDVEDAKLSIQPEGQRVFRNWELWQYLQNAQQMLKKPYSVVDLPQLKAELHSQAIFPRVSSLSIVPTLHDIITATASHSVSKPGQLITAVDFTSRIHQSTNILCQQVPPITTNQYYHVSNIEQCESHDVDQSQSTIMELRKVIDPYISSNNVTRRVYGSYLQQSLTSFQTLRQKPLRGIPLVDTSRLQLKLSFIQDAVSAQFLFIQKMLNKDPSFEWLNRGGLWPKVTPISLLETLATKSCIKVPEVTRKNITGYGELITAWQRLLRIEGVLSSGEDLQLREQLREELDSEIHTEWSPEDFPDWLLLEIENNILIRKDQHRVAKAMIAPGSGENSVLQMNMGQGKSSVIIPMVAAVLADTKQLFRVIVPKPLLRQMAQILQARLGGLLGRAIKHIPFSRKSSTSSENIQQYWELHGRAMTNRGIILVLPEHLLSFKLSALQCLSNGKNAEAALMIKTQSWLVSNSRDVLDECDHSLAVKTQLIYPSGSQNMVDGHPHRWKVAEAVLYLAKSRLEQLQRDFPQSMEINYRSRSGGFPEVYFSSASVKDTLIQQITDSASRGENGILPVTDCSAKELSTLVRALRNSTIPKEDIPSFSKLFKNHPSARQDLLVLRGLLVHRILLMALNKRWNVQYGLHPNRDPVAVPFQAKGVPSEQAEFGHPDVSILLTCLSWYYAGLTLNHFNQVLRHLSRSDDPASEYDRWLQNAPSIPDNWRIWAAINIDDEVQCKELWDQLRHNMDAVNFFLNNFVFPNHAKTFERKLVTSAWDIPLQSLEKSLESQSECDFSSPKNKGFYEISNSLTTGFSGTNDNRTLLPLNIKQQDLKELSHTNAEVLAYLLQQRNRRYQLAADARGKRLSEVAFLKLIYQHKIRMLLDAGAQIVELSNLDLVKRWLSIDTEAEAAVFFKEDDTAQVQYRDGRSQPLVASPFVNNLGVCLVYLDEAHTRGTDLKMPRDSVAALTLGPGQTKDHTVQAAMRLRHLGTSQSVIFFAPPEVHQGILSLRGRPLIPNVDSYDVISWLLDQTCRSIEQLQPLYISHGLDFCSRTLAALDNYNATTDPEHRNRYMKALEQLEQYSLENLYGLRKRSKKVLPITSDLPLVTKYIKTLNQMKEAVLDNGDMVQALAYQEVEQEREVAIEVEVVREMKRPPKITPLKHLPIHHDLIDFVKEGRLRAISPAYEQVFTMMRRTKLGMRFRISSRVMESKLYVTSDFVRTVQLDPYRPRDDFIRPVHWVLWNMTSEAAMIISPHEAEELIADMRDRPCRTHLISYAARVTRSMLFDSLKYYSVPSLPTDWHAPDWLVRDLGIFAGRLYFEYKEYESICDFLGLKQSRSQQTKEEVEKMEYLQGVDRLPEDGESQPFSQAPLEFLQEWLAIRRKGQDFSQTPMGYVCCGKEVKPNAVFFAQ